MLATANLSYPDKLAATAPFLFYKIFKPDTMEHSDLLRTLGTQPRTTPTTEQRQSGTPTIEIRHGLRQGAFREFGVHQ